MSSVVCILVCHDSEPCKNGSTDRDAVWVVDTGGPQEPRIRRQCTMAQSVKYDLTIHVQRRCGGFVKVLRPLVCLTSLLVKTTPVVDE